MRSKDLSDLMKNFRFCYECGRQPVGPKGSLLCPACRKEMDRELRDLLTDP